MAGSVVGGCSSSSVLLLTHKVVAGDSLPKREFNQINSEENF